MLVSPNRLLYTVDVWHNRWMTTPASKSDSDVWRLEGTQAVLQTPQLSASIDLLKPQLGLNKLNLHGNSLSGFVLGVSPGAETPLLLRDLTEVFVRGDDLVATYGETEERPFSLQVYWRVTASEQGVLLLDTILSLQTDLLESFPGLAVESELPATAALVVPLEGMAASEVKLSAGQSCQMPGDSAESLLLQSVNSAWSYVEMSSPEDRGLGQLRSLDSGSYHVQRQLGGRFLEKGVLHRLRVRGAFLPCENDVERAAKCLVTLAAEEPPLTV